MESYFSDNQYPDEAKREDIATACNAVIHKPGKKLTDLERVTSLKVYNWFANRRKDIKRRANIGNVYLCLCGDCSYNQCDFRTQHDEGTWKRNACYLSCWAEVSDSL
ncbi:homeobox-containing protein 1-like [Hippoglossus stenolepis]|nr:homeobox-containing protein 1-like [Hippoglossus stenolepis]